jgi:hypothetical protein
MQLSLILKALPKIGLAFILYFSASVGWSSAFANDRVYFKNIQGNWAGAGKIVAGTYKDTEFNCKLKGTSIAGNTGMEIKGSCRVGLFSQPISAVIKKKGNTYKGTYLDGAKGQGLDVVSGKLKNKRLIVGLHRKKLDGAMVVNTVTNNTMKITISVKTKRGLVPVIGVTLKRS